MTKRILAYILFVLGFLTVMFFRNYCGEIIPYPFLFWLLGLAMFLAGFFLLRTTPTIKEKKDIEKIKIAINNIKATGEKINVDFSTCEVKENNYFEEREIYNSATHIGRGIQGWNALSDSTKNTERVLINQSVIIFKADINGMSETFVSGVLPYDRETLLFLLYAKKETTLYIDKNNMEYYFDLEILFK